MVMSFLPPHGPGVRDLSRAGRWEEEEAFTLAQLSDALDLQGSGIGSVATTSIPDVWAQPLGFLAAWREPSHPGFHRARGEWRGMLATLAFSELLDLGIDILDVDLDDLGRNPWDTRGTKPPGMAGNLPAILAAFQPRAKLLGEQTWARLG